MAPRTSIGVDIGGTTCRVGLCAEDGEVRNVTTLPTPGLADSFFEKLGAAVAKVRGASPPSESIVGIGIPGLWDRQTGIMHRSVNLPFLEGVSIRGRFEATVGGPVRIDSDAAAAGRAQWRLTEGPPARFAYLSIGTGIGGCVILDGQVVRHSRGGAGVFGHMIVDTSDDAPVCRCGARGCLEAIGCGPAMQQSRNRLEQAAPSDPRQSGRKNRMAAAEGAGDGGIHAAVIERAARGLAFGCYQIAAIYATDVIALGGGVVDFDADLIEAVSRHLDHIRGSVIPAHLRVIKAPLASAVAGVTGAALMAME